jgi:hypothetical protein
VVTSDSRRPALSKNVPNAPVRAHVVLSPVLSCGVVRFASQLKQAESGAVEDGRVVLARKIERSSDRESLLNVAL